MSGRSGGCLRVSARMTLRSETLWLLVLVAVARPESCVGASSHSLKYFSTSISEPSQGLPQFVAQGYVDSQIFVHYDSHTRRMQPRVSWMEKVGKEDPQYWETETQASLVQEEASREILEILRNRYNQSKGFHTWQKMYGCELHRDGSEGFLQYGYEGRTFLQFNKEALTWEGNDPQAQIMQRKWDAVPEYNQRDKSYLEVECIDWLEKYLSYGKETLLRTEPPAVTMRGKTEMEDDGMETHVCRLDGFYPREIDAFWTRDGEVWAEETFHGFLVPNADGTYHYWLSIRINPKERGRYRCHVEHDGLLEPLDLALEEPKSNLGIIIGCVMAALVLVGVIAGILVFFKKRQDYYKATPTSDGGSNSSDQGKSLCVGNKEKLSDSENNQPMEQLALGSCGSAIT